MTDHDKLNPLISTSIEKISLLMGEADEEIDTNNPYIEEELSTLFYDVDNFLFIANKRIDVKFNKKEDISKNQTNEIINELANLIETAAKLLEICEFVFDRSKLSKREFIYEKIRRLHVAHGRLKISWSLGSMFKKTHDASF